MDVLAHANLHPSPALPDESWTSDLSVLSFVSFATLYRHFVERQTNVMLFTDGADQSVEESAAGESGEVFTIIPWSWKRLQIFQEWSCTIYSIQFFAKNSAGMCYVCAQVLPSSETTKKYSVRVY